MFDWLGSALDSVGSLFSGGGDSGITSSGATDAASGASDSSGSSGGLFGLGGGLTDWMGSIGGRIFGPGAGSWIPGLLGGAAGYLGTSSTNAANLALVSAQNSAAMARQKETQDWEANMANTAEQRQVADLEKAGLNPMLAVHGSGAAVPNVSAPPVYAGQVQNALGSAVGTAISSASAVQDLRLRAAQVENQEAQTSQTLAQARKSNIDADSSALDLASKQFRYGTPSSQFGTMFQKDWADSVNASSISADNAVKAAFDARNSQLQGEVLSRERQSRDYSMVSEKAAADVSSSLVGRDVLPWLERISPLMGGSARAFRDMGLAPR